MQVHRHITFYQDKPTCCHCLRWLHITQPDHMASLVPIHIDRMLFYQPNIEGASSVLLVPWPIVTHGSPSHWRMRVFLGHWSFCTLLVVPSLGPRAVLWAAILTWVPAQEFVSLPVLWMTAHRSHVLHLY